VEERTIFVVSSLDNLSILTRDKSLDKPKLCSSGPERPRKLCQGMEVKSVNKEDEAVTERSNRSQSSVSDISVVWDVIKHRDGVD
jgi:hypothetical protein